MQKHSASRLGALGVLASMNWNTETLRHRVKTQSKILFNFSVSNLCASVSLCPNPKKMLGALASWR
jgi:hypothetical protein